MSLSNTAQKYKVQHLQLHSHPTPNSQVSRRNAFLNPDAYMAKAHAQVSGVQMVRFYLKGWMAV